MSTNCPLTSYIFILLFVSFYIRYLILTYTISYSFSFTEVEKDDGSIKSLLSRGQTLL